MRDGIEDNRHFGDRCHGPTGIRIRLQYVFGKVPRLQSIPEGAGRAAVRPGHRLLFNKKSTEDKSRRANVAAHAGSYVWGVVFFPERPSAISARTRKSHRPSDGGPRDRLPYSG